MTNSPAAMNKAPLVYTGAAVCRFANIAMMGYRRRQYSAGFPNGRHDEGRLTAIIPKILLVLAVNAFPVPLSLVGKISGVYA